MGNLSKGGNVQGESVRGGKSPEGTVLHSTLTPTHAHMPTHTDTNAQTRTHIGDRTDSRADSEKGVVLSEDAFVQKPRRRRNISMKLIKFITSTYNIYHIII